MASVYAFTVTVSPEAAARSAIEQLQLYVPEFIELLKKLADTGCVEFLSGTFSHGLASLEDPEEFIRQVKVHDDIMQRLFGVKPKVFANTELIYDDEIATLIAGMGFKTVLTEGAKHILGWKSPNYLYQSASAPELKLLLTNNKLADDIALNFNNTAWDEYPLTADKYIDWLASLPEQEQVVNLYMSMETFGSFLPKDSGIFDFMRALPRFAKEKGVCFTTPSDVVAKLKPVDMILSVSSIRVGMNRRAMDIIMDSSWTGTRSFFSGPIRLSSPSVRDRGEVV